MIYLPPVRNFIPHSHRWQRPAAAYLRSARSQHRGLLGNFPPARWYGAGYSTQHASTGSQSLSWPFCQRGTALLPRPEGIGGSIILRSGAAWCPVFELRPLDETVHGTRSSFAMTSRRPATLSNPAG